MKRTYTKIMKKPSDKSSSFRKRDRQKFCQKFCCICNNTTCDLIHGKPVKLHSFPDTFKLKEAWIRRLKSVKPDYEWSTNHVLCSAHFIRGVCDGANPVPSIFTVKDMERIYKHPILPPSQINQKKVSPREPPSPLVQLGESLHDWHAAATLFGQPMSKFVCHLLYVHAKYCLQCAALSRVMTRLSERVGRQKTADNLDVEHSYHGYDFTSSELENPAPDENAVVRSIDQSTGETSPVKQQRNDRSLMCDYYGEAALKHLIPEVNNTEGQRKLIDSGEVEVYIMKRLDSRIAPIEKNVKFDATANSRKVRFEHPSTMSNQEYYEQPISHSKSNRNKRPLSKKPQIAVTRVHSDHPRSLLKSLTIPHRVVDNTSAHPVGKTAVYPADDGNVPLDDDNTTDDDTTDDDDTTEDDDMNKITKFQHVPMSKYSYDEPQSNIMPHTPIPNSTDDIGNVIHLPDEVSSDTPQSDDVLIRNTCTLTQANSTVPQKARTMTAPMDEATMAINGLLQSPEFMVVADLGPIVPATMDSTSLDGSSSVNPPNSTSKRRRRYEKKSYRYQKNPVSCPKCHAVLSSLQGLFVHMRLHITDPRFTCNICGKDCHSKRVLDDHMGRHSDSNTHPCTICDRKLLSSDSLKHHMKAHGGVKDLPCKICNKLFVVKSQVRSHMQSAHGIGNRVKQKKLKKFECEYCGKTFFSRGALLTHHNVHDEIPKDRTCQYCGKMFANDPSLVHHISNIHKERPKRIRKQSRIVCHLCGRTLWSDNLRTHNKRRHKDQD